MPEYIIDNHTIAFTRQAMNAAHQAYPREFAEWNLALFQKGKAVLPGVTVREIRKPYTTWADTVQESASAGVPYPECTGAGRESEQCKDAPQPVDAGGEWPKWRHGGGIGGRGVLLHFESEHVATRYRRGCKPDARSGNLYRWSQNSHLAVSRDYAIGWLRENGHAQVADELEGEGRGEWPRWTKYRTRVIRYDADTSGVEYHPFIAPFRNVSAVFGFAARTECGSELEITEAEALSWLRSNGNEAEAAKLEGDRFEPVGLCRS